MSDKDKERDPEALGFYLEDRGGTWVVQFCEGGCRPATIPEKVLWDARQLGRASLAAAQSPFEDCYVCGRPMDGLSEDDCHCFHRKELRASLAASAAADCARCSGSGEDPEGFYDQTRGDAGHTHAGPCRDCSGSGVAASAGIVGGALIKQILDALENSRVLKSDHESLQGYGIANRKHAAAITAARDYLAASAGSEPVAWRYRSGSNGRWEDCTKEVHDMVLRAPQRWAGYEVQPLYAHPSPPEGMVMVPRDLTIDSPVRDVLINWIERAIKGDSFLYAEMWKALIAAAPPIAAGGGKEAG